MQFLQFKRELKDFPLFNLSDIRKIDEEFDLRRLSEWQVKGYIKKLRRGFYIFSEAKIEEATLFLLANHLNPPSYVSLESALAHYSLIPESVYIVTNVTSNKTIRFETPVAQFGYRSVRPELMFGYKLMSKECGSYKIAEPEKAVLDYLYFHPEVMKEEAFNEWRFNSDEFKKIVDMDKFGSYVQLFGINAFRTRVERFLSLVEHSK